MTSDPLVLGPELDQATERMLTTAAGLDDAALAEPSGLPGWTRGHVLAHLARNADSYVNLLTSARTGEHIPPYASPQARNDGIEAGAGRPLAEHLDDLRGAAQRLREAMAAMPPEAWTVAVATHRGPRVAATVVWGRLREVEVHHVDLAAGYTPAHWPEAFGHRLLREVVGDLGGRVGAPALRLRPDGAGQPLTIGAGGPGASGPGASGPEVSGPEVSGPEVSGPVRDLAGWLTGRGDGAGLRVDPPGPLPALPEWM